MDDPEPGCRDNSRFKKLRSAKILPSCFSRLSTLVATLPKVMDQIYQRFDTSAGDRAEFVGLHAWAHRFLTASGRKVMFNPQQAGSFLESAARSASQQYASSGITQAYARDEVSWVIKGRGLTTLAEYLKVSRDGRGSPLRPDQRATMWAIAADYERRLGKAGLLDENDLLIEATKLVQSEGLAAPYSLVVVDEAQDLTLVGARLVAAIAERSGGRRSRIVRASARSGAPPRRDRTKLERRTGSKFPHPSVRFA